MIGLTYAENSRDRANFCFDLTKYWKQTISHTGVFKINSTDYSIKLSGTFDSRTQAHLIESENAAIISNDLFDLFYIKFDERLIKHHKMSWELIYKKFSCVVVEGIGELAVAKNFCFYEYYYDKDLKISNIDDNSIILEGKCKRFLTIDI